MACDAPDVGYERLEAKHLAAVREGDAETLLRELVVHELISRHLLGWTLEGPPLPNVGGTDLRVRLVAPPRSSRETFAQHHRCEPLTFDETAVDVVYSVKSGVTGKQHALDEAQNRAPWAAEALANGGRLVVVLMTPKDDAPKKPAKKKAAAAAATPQTTFTQKLQERYRARVRTLNDAAPDPTERIHVVDCNDLLTYLQHVRPALSLTVLGLLGIAPLPGLLDIARWDADHRRDRAPTPAYVWDDERTQNATQILAALKDTANAPRALWLLSPPGVGKTRLILETLRRDDDDAPLRARVRAVTDPAIAERAISQDALFSHYGDAILIVDDCREDDVFRLDRLFHQHATEPAARLLLITPMAAAGQTAQAPPGLDMLALEPLDSAAVRDLIASEAGLPADDARVIEIATQTDGYPWFAVLVTRNIRELNNPPRVRSLSQAVDLALAPVGPDHVPAVRRHSAALMAVMLASEDIDLLSPDEKRSLLAFLNDFFADWATLRAAITECSRRGLIRVSEAGAIRYVTPAILELEIAKRFLGPNPEGGHPGGIGPGHLLRQRLDRLLQRLQSLGFAGQPLAVVTTPIIDHLIAEPSGVASFDRITRAELEFAAASSPLATCRAIRQLIEAASIEELHQDTGRRRPIMFALQAIVSRRGTFDDVEPALFRLASAENETYANNATRTWAGLFDVELNQTYETLERRMHVLERRADDGNVRSKELALAAIGRMLSLQSFKMAAEPRDGPFSRPSANEAREARARAWFILGRFLRDGIPKLRHESARLAARELASTLRIGLTAAAAGALVSSLDALTERDLRELRTAVDNLNDHHRALVERDVEAREAWERLLAALRPQSFADRLRQQVGTWSRVISQRDESHHDRELAREALENPSELSAQLDWLETSDAVRGVHFLVTLGSEDRDGRFLSELETRAATAPGMISGYLAGHESAGREELVNATLLKLRSEPRTATALVDAIWRLPPSLQRVMWLREALEGGCLEERIISGLASGPFVHGLDDESLDVLVMAMLQTTSRAAAIVAIRAITSRLSHTASGRREHLLVLLERALLAVGNDAPEGHHGYIWNEGAKTLLKARESEDVIDQLIGMLVNDREVLPRPELVEVLQVAAKKAPRLVWEKLAPQLDGSARARTLTAAARETSLLHELPAEAILDWVGNDEDRGVAVAEMIDLHGPDAPGTLAKAVIARFGDPSRVSGIIASDLHSTPRGYESLSRFAGETLERMMSWRGDARPNVRHFTERLLRELRDSRDFYAAREKRERRLGS